jgi:putative solute:sodium symporter small subunit
MAVPGSADDPGATPVAGSLRAYWRRTRLLTAGLLLLWFAASFPVAWFARPLAQFHLFGWPLSFYMVAQGSLVVYVAIVWVYYRRMRVYDLDGGVAEREDR